MLRRNSKSGPSRAACISSWKNCPLAWLTPVVQRDPPLSSIALSGVFDPDEDDAVGTQPWRGSTEAVGVTLVGVRIESSATLHQLLAPAVSWIFTYRALVCGKYTVMGDAVDVPLARAAPQLLVLFDAKTW